MAKMAARLLATAPLMGSNPGISQKYKMGDICKGVANTLQPSKKYTKTVSVYRFHFSSMKGWGPTFWSSRTRIHA
jgi:hypothetical protein